MTAKKHIATGASHGNLTPISGKFVADSNVTQGNVQAGLLILDGAGTVSELFNGVQISIENAVTCADAGLYIGGSGSAKYGIDIGGSGIDSAEIILTNNETIDNLTDFDNETTIH